LLDDLNARAASPDLKLIARGRTKRVGSADEHFVAFILDSLRQLADRRSLSDAVNADDHKNIWADGFIHGSFVGDAGFFFEPTVVTQVRQTDAIVQDETFGPVIPIIRCPNDIAKVIRISNSTNYGLSSGVCTNRLDYITRFISELDVGTVNVWEVPGYRIEMSPFGGIKDSGLGIKEGVVEAMKSFTNTKTYSIPW